jgi:hypothetical protein
MLLVDSQIRPKLPELTALRVEAEPDVLTLMTFPKGHRVKSKRRTHELSILSA